jgi:FkbM family methyltransferase
MSASNELSSLANVAVGNSVGELTIKLTPFDQRRYRALTAARAETIRRVIEKLRLVFPLAGALDAGCGVGFFAETLAECGLNVCAFDGRGENIKEARRRFPNLAFEIADIQDHSILQLGRFDLVLCCGLLYHLENPLQAIRHLRGLTDKCLLLESMCIPEGKPALLLRDEPREDDQSLTDVAWYPSEGCLVKMLYRAGFPAVYRVAPLPNHEDFRDTPEHARRRTVLLASTATLDISGFRLCPEPRETQDPWKKSEEGRPNFPRRIGRFLASSRRRQYITMALRARRIWPEMPIPLRLPMGAWWLAEKGALDQELMYESFEDAEMRLVSRLLRPGMTVVDIGAHHGLYSLLAAKLVGRRGRVLAFEPSPRERRRLQRHLRLNGYRNVEIEERAVADASGEADLFVVQGFRDWGNSLRPPAVPEPTERVRVRVCQLDEALAERGLRAVDFIKLDAEGAELAVLYGASELLQRAPRPAILAEVQDLRTRAWGYAAREITALLASWNYQWFGVGEVGDLYPVNGDDASYDANLVALPRERVEEFLSLIDERRAK